MTSPLRSGSLCRAEPITDVEHGGRWPPRGSAHQPEEDCSQYLAAANIAIRCRSRPYLLVT